MTTRKQRKARQNRYAKRTAQAKRRQKEIVRQVANRLLDRKPSIITGHDYHYRTTFIHYPAQLGVITGIEP